MRRSPNIDGRRKEAIRDEIRAIAPYYTPEWDPNSTDSGAALVTTFADIAEDVLTRLDRVPERQFVSFLDSLGARRTPPQPSRLPLQVAVPDEAPKNVLIGGGTRAVAEETDEHPKQVFEVGDDDGFEATAANVTHLYSVDPAVDAIYDHGGVLSDRDHATLFDGSDEQDHTLYIGDADLLTLGGGSTVRLTVETNASKDVLLNAFTWEYYGEVETDGEPMAKWQSLDRPSGTPQSASDLSEIQPVRAFVDEHRDLFRSQGYDLVEHEPGLRSRILAALAATIAEPSQRDAAGGAPTETDPQLPPTIAPPDAFGPTVRARLRRELGELRGRLEEVSKSVSSGDRERPTTVVTMTFELPTPTVDHTVNGVQSRWLRCRFPDGELARSIFDIEFENVSVEVGMREAEARSALLPDTLLSDDVPLPPRTDDGPLYPFGRVPQPRATFYLASSETFTKPGTTVELEFLPTDSPTTTDSDPSVELSWQYWNGNGWTRLPHFADKTASLTGAGRVRFDVPHDLEPRRVAGHEGHWIRARLVAGDYGRVRYEETNDGTWERTTNDVKPPRFGGVTLGYSQASPPAHLLPYNNLAYDEEVTDGATVPFRPFTGLPEPDQTLYVGFDGPLYDGPIQLYVPLAESEQPAGFDPRLRWESHDAEASGRWSKLEVRDDTNQFEQSGIVGIVFPDSTVASERFGVERHWLRARVTADRFTTPAVPLLEPRLKHAVTTPRNVPEPHRPLLRGEHSTDVLVAAPPTLRQVQLNTGWAYNQRTVTAEVLGSSDGSAAQSFSLARPPVTTNPATVWVDELATLPAERRREFLETRPSTVDAVTDDDGELRAFWIRWSEVGAFLDSGSDARHYTLDRAAGTVTFGDGKHGKIPPRGRNNVRATYPSGGGIDGNVPSHAVTKLQRSIPFVKSVTNPDPASGGTDEESNLQIRRRAPRRFRDRGRSVSPADFERIAVDAAGEVAHAKCIPGTDATGGPVPGRVTVLIVPEERERRPVPSVALKRRVTAELRERAPATLVVGDRGGLVVRGPNFVDIEVAATVEATAVESLSTLEDVVANRLTAFLHPLGGGPNADGWSFGTVPRRGDVYAVLETTEGVDHVVNIALTFRHGSNEITVTESDQVPRVPSDTLVFSGRHDITAIGGR